MLKNSKSLSKNTTTYVCEFLNFQYQPRICAGYMPSFSWITSTTTKKSCTAPVHNAAVFVLEKKKRFTIYANFELTVLGKKKPGGGRPQAREHILCSEKGHGQFSFTVRSAPGEMDCSGTEWRTRAVKSCAREEGRPGVKAFFGSFCKRPAILNS